jgi:ABC-type dipeptide/oligopeptide/nickel transport system permease component
MIAYLIRRLLLMIPTLLGITLLVFLLIALSPGGIGAALQLAGGEAEATNRAIQEAYLEDRYGLGDNVFLQYSRWLGRISPVKVGTRDQIALDGDRISSPRTIDPPPLWRWYADRDDLPDLPREHYEFEEGLTPSEKDRIYRAALNEYMRQRAGFVARRIHLRDAVAVYARAHGLGRFVGGDGVVDFDRVASHEPDKTADEWPAVAAAGEALLEQYETALAAQRRLQAIFDAQPYPEAGYAVIPGFVWLGAPDLGTSFSRSRPVGSLIAEALPVTLLLNFIAFPIIYLVAIPFGMLAAVRRGTWVDVGSGLLFVGLWSIPIVWAGVLAIGFLAKPGYFPVSGIIDSDAANFTYLPTWSTEDGWHRGVLLDVLWHITLPVICLVYGGFAVLSKQTRAAMLENLNADYVRTARAKGVPRKDVIFKHVFRNSLLPLITMFVTIFPAMLSGSVVIERIFTVPGMGSLVIDAIYLRDREVILAVTLIIAAVNMAALLLADILYALADPRITYN